ncbi:hypothetical protein ACOSP7_027412 [Xanthoceras sorbifolium]
MAKNDAYSRCLSDSILKPRCGLEFDLEKAAYDFYNMYGRNVGFSIRRESYGKNNKTSELTSRTFVCSKYDNEEQITNIFWADARMIIDYGQFGDVVSFDTTYKIDKENRLFAIFVGLNHHRETIVFGAALMYDETTDSFIWLFEKFLQAMSGKAPKSIFTNQDAAMVKALTVVMLETNHRLCMWHMMQNALQHVSGMLRGPGGVKSVLSRFMDNIEEESQFITKCYSMHDNDRLKSIFKNRNKWAYVYVKQAWSAGMKSTQLSESFNASLKDYLKSNLNLSQFFMHFERMVNDKRYKELEAEYDL